MKAAVQKRKENIYPLMLVAKRMNVVFRHNAAPARAPEAPALRMKKVTIR